MDEKMDSGFTKLKEAIDDLHHTMINEIKELKRTKGE